MADETVQTEQQNSTTPTTASPSPSDASPATPESSTTPSNPDGTEKPSTILAGASGDGDAGGDAAGADGNGGDTGGTGDGDKAPEPNALIGAPEGDYEITGLPEGVTIDKPVLDALVPIAKEIGISNEGMSRLAATYNETILPHVAQQIVTGIQNDIAATRSEWADQLRASVEGETADPVFAGAKLADVTRISAKAIDRFGGEEFRGYLDETGLGNHPAMLKLLYQVGTKIAEDTGFERGGTTPQPKTDVEIFYGSKT
jgi:hypothetical protein